MKLLTAAIKKKIEKSPIYTHDGKKPEDVNIICKFFAPWGAWSWFVTEANLLDNGDYEFFGLVENQYGQELGYFRLSELESIRGQFGLGIERDRGFEGTLANVKK